MSANYTEQSWADGDATKPLSAARMTHIEDGLAAVDTAASSYTDTKVAAEATRANGYTDTKITAEVSRANSAYAPAGSTGSAYVFKPESYGALGDGKLITGVATTSGSGVITATNGFTGATVGQWVLVHTSQGGFFGQITTVTSASQVTISANAPATDTGLFAIWGTDDTAAINSAVAAAKTYAEAHDYFAEIQFSDKAYIVAAMTQTASTANGNFYAQIPIPAPTNNNGRKLILSFKGVGRVDHISYWFTTLPNITGTTIVSLKQVAQPDGGVLTGDSTYGAPAVFGTPVPTSGMAGANNNNPVFINVKPIFRDITVTFPYLNTTHVSGFNFDFATGAYVDGCSVMAFATPLGGPGMALINAYPSLNGTACGLRMPKGGNNADVMVGKFSAEGICIGLLAPCEHLLCQDLTMMYTGVAVRIPDQTIGHGLTIVRCTAEAYQGGILLAGGSRMPIYVHEWNTEVNPQAYDISDQANGLTGFFNMNCSDVRTPIVVGSTGIKVTNMALARGVWTGKPSVPTSTTPQQNTAWRDAVVVVSGGTVSSISVDGVTQGVTSGPVFVPSGKNITLTYTVAPTWTWSLQ